MDRCLGSTRIRTLAVVFACLSWAPLEAQVSGPSQSTDNAVARWDGEAGLLQDSKLVVGDHGEVNDVRFAAAYAPSPTGGIQEAIDSCGTGFAAGTYGCVVVLPRGEVAVRTTIQVGGTQGKSGLVLVGHGSGQQTSPNAHSMAGTTLVWQGASGGTVLRIQSVSWSRFGDFAIDGKGTAGVAIDVTTLKPNPPQGSEEDLFENIYIDRLQASGSVGVRVAPPSDTNYQVSEITFRRFVIRGSAVSFLQDGQQTANIRYENNDLGCSDSCLKLVDGTSMVSSNVFGSSPGSFADIWIGERMGPLTMIGNYHETQGTHAVYSELDTPAVDGWRLDPITMIGSVISQYNDGNYIVYHQQPAPFNIIGCYFYAQKAGHHATLYFNNPGTGENNLKVFSAGSVYTSGIRTSFNGEHSLVAEDGLGSAPQIQGKTPVTWTNIAEVRKLGSENWANGAGAVQYSWYLENPDTDPILALYRGGAVRGYYDDGTWVSGVSMPLVFQGANADANRTAIAVEEPTTDATVTIPNLSGTVVVSNGTASATRMLCGNVSVDPPSIANGSSGDALATVSGLAANDACTCSPRADWDDKLILKYCAAGEDSLVARLFSANAFGPAIDAGAQTVDFCCVRK
jgi:hypothetical protein